VVNPLITEDWDFGSGRQASQKTLPNSDARRPRHLLEPLQHGLIVPDPVESCGCSARQAERVLYGCARADSDADQSGFDDIGGLRQTA